MELSRASFFEERLPRRQWLAQLRQRGLTEIAMVFSVLLIYFGVRQPSLQQLKETVEQASEQMKQIPKMIRNASRDGIASMARGASDQGLHALGQASNMLQAAAETGFRRAVAIGGSRSRSQSRESSHNDTSSFKREETSSFKREDRQRSGQDPDAHDDAGEDMVVRSLTRKEIVATSFTGRIDSVLNIGISYKVVMLLLFLMPQNYFFGAKMSFLRWASTATLFRLYLKITPLATAALIACTAMAARYSPRMLPSHIVSGWQTKSLLNVLLTYSISRLFELIRGDPTPMLELETSAQKRDMVNFEPPSLSFLQTVVSPLRKAAPDVWLDIEKLPKPPPGADTPRRLLFVGNHMIWAMDCLHLVVGLREKTGIALRPIGEHSWFAIPVLGELVSFVGGIDGTRDNCGLLMEKGENMLVFPGGLREAWKHGEDEKYSLIWPEHHLGFAKMAIRHGYTIIPLATVGMEDIIGSVHDLDVKNLTSLGGLISHEKGTSKAFEVPAAPVPWKVGDLQTIYYGFGTPINTEDIAGRDTEEDLVRRVRDQTKTALEARVRELLAYRESDPARFTRRYLDVENGLIGQAQDADSCGGMALPSESVGRPHTLARL